MGVARLPLQFRRRLRFYPIHPQDLPRAGAHRLRYAEGDTERAAGWSFRRGDQPRAGQCSGLSGLCIFAIGGGGYSRQDQRVFRRAGQKCDPGLRTGGNPGPKSRDRQSGPSLGSIQTGFLHRFWRKGACLSVHCGGSRPGTAGSGRRDISGPPEAPGLPSQWREYHEPLCPGTGGEFPESGPADTGAGSDRPGGDGAQLCELPGGRDPAGLPADRRISWLHLHPG